MVIRTKIEVGDIDGYTWNWSDKYTEEFIEELARAFMVSFLATVPDAPISELGRIATEWARVEAGNKIILFENVTRDRIRYVVSQGIAQGKPLRSISKLIQDDHIFSRERATLIARTETATALGHGAQEAASSQGRDEKRWVTQGDDLVSDECMNNEWESRKWISIADPFFSGVMTIPQHPNCRCNVRYRTKALHEPDAGSIIVETGMRRDFRCTGCNRLLARNAPQGVRIHCRHCKQEREA